MSFMRKLADKLLGRERRAKRKKKDASIYPMF
jgi:hypothetical protein